MQADTIFATDLLSYGHVVPKPADQSKCSFKYPGGSNSPNLVPTITQTTRTGSLSLVADQTSAPVVFLPVKFGDLAVSAWIDSVATYNFLVASPPPKLRD